MQPGGKGRLAPKSANFAEELKKGFLHQVFRVRRIIHHPETQGVNATAVHLIEKLKCGGATRLGQPNSFRFRHRFGGLSGSRRIRSAWSVSGQRSNSGASTRSDAPSPPLSCPDFRPRESKRHPSKGRFVHYGVRAPAGEQVGLLSRERAHSSMAPRDRKSTRLNSSHVAISYAVFCLKKKNI